MKQSRAVSHLILTIKRRYSPFLLKKHLSYRIKRCQARLLYLREYSLEHLLKNYLY